MPARGRRTCTAAMKARVAIDALREQKTAAQLASECNGHPSQGAQWKREAMEGLTTLFATPRHARFEDRQIVSLDEQIGRLKMALEWFTKQFGASA